MNFIEKYKRNHTYPMNQWTHTIGIPTIVASLVVVFYDWKLV